MESGEQRDLRLRVGSGEQHRQCTVTYPGPAGSPHSITAAYSGDTANGFLPSSSTTLSQVVNRARTGPSTATLRFRCAGIPARPADAARWLACDRSELPNWCMA
jgi:hypothetical protein